MFCFQFFQTLVKTWTDFARDLSSFRFRDTPWKSLTKGQKLKYMRLDKEGGFLDGDHIASRLKIWEKLNIL